MAMNLGYKTKIMVVGTTDDIRMSNYIYDNLFNKDGTPNKKYYDSDGKENNLSEEQYIDLGIVTGESEDTSIGSLATSIPTAGAGSRVVWAVGGRVLRIVLNGIIPDGSYVSTDPKFNGKSNSSVFRYKLNKFFAYKNIAKKDETTGKREWRPATVQYRRYGIDEKEFYVDAGNNNYIKQYDYHNKSEIASWVCTSYSASYIEGTKSMRYTIALDFANDIPASGYDVGDDINGIRPKDVGDL